MAVTFPRCGWFRKCRVCGVGEGEKRAHARGKSAGRPVSRVLFHPPLGRMATVIYLARRSPGRSSSLPESRNGPDRPCSLIWPCSLWGLPSQPVTRLLVCSYLHLFTLT